MPAFRKSVGVTVVVDSTRLFLPSGQVSVWLDELADDTAEAAKHEAPERTGELRASIRSGPPFIAGPRLLYADVTAHSPHAVYVHEGTAANGTGYIYPHGKALGPLPAPYPRFAAKVRGQKPNPFLVDGFNSVSRRRGLKAHMS